MRTTPEEPTVGRHWRSTGGWWGVPVTHEGRGSEGETRRTKRIREILNPSRNPNDKGDGSYDRGSEDVPGVGEEGVASRRELVNTLSGSPMTRRGGSRDYEGKGLEKK